jgi:putative intracellular protease/amidase
VQVNIVLVPRMVQLDVTGPFEVLARVPGWSISLVAATLDPVRTDRGLRIVPDVTRENAAAADLLVIPGGTGVDAAMLDPAWIAFVQRQAESADHVFGICTGSLLLAAAGLLRGRRAGGHWQARDLLTQFGVTPSDDRVTVDANTTPRAASPPASTWPCASWPIWRARRWPAKSSLPSSTIRIRLFRAARLSRRPPRSCRPFWPTRARVVPNGRAWWRRRRHASPSSRTSTDRHDSRVAGGIRR